MVGLKLLNGTGTVFNKQKLRSYICLFFRLTRQEKEDLELAQAIAASQDQANQEQHRRVCIYSIMQTYLPPLPVLEGDSRF